MGLETGVLMKRVTQVDSVPGVLSGSPDVEVEGFISLGTLS